MTIEMVERKNRESGDHIILPLESKTKFNLSNYTIPFSQFKMKSNSEESTRKINIKKLSKYSDEFRDILKKELF